MGHTCHSQPLIARMIAITQQTKQYAAIASGGSNAVKEETKKFDRCEAGGGNKIFENRWISRPK